MNYIQQFENQDEYTPILGRFQLQFVRQKSMNVSFYESFNALLLAAGVLGLTNNFYELGNSEDC